VLPVLVIGGAISLSALVTFGVAAASVAAVLVVAIGVGTGRVASVSPSVTRLLFAGGGAAAFGGILNTADGPRSASFVSIGIALLACCAMLSMHPKPTL
jgi:hypothetical protein